VRLRSQPGSWWKRSSQSFRTARAATCAVVRSGVGALMAVRASLSARWRWPAFSIAARRERRLRCAAPTLIDARQGVLCCQACLWPDLRAFFPAACFCEACLCGPAF
jgi:hypothetical protein